MLSTRVVAALFAGILLTATPAGAVGGVVASAPSSAPVDGDAAAIGSAPALQQVGGNNSSVVRHENPDTTNRDGRLDQVSAHLSGVLAGRLTAGAVDISQSEYQRARGLLGDEYSESLGKFVDVAGETGLGGTGDQFDRARETEREFADAVQSYRETRRAYERAREAGNDARARRLARELDDDAENVSELGTQLTGTFARIATRTGVDLDEASTAINRTTANVTETQAAIRAAEFVETELSLQVRRSAIAYTDPLRATGRLTTADGDPLSDRRLRLRIGGDPTTVRTDAEGRFDLTYRPVTIPTGATTLRVRYLPDRASVYYGTTTAVTVTVTQTQPTLRIDGATARVAFAESVDATGRVTVPDGEQAVGVAGVPLALSVDGVRLAAAETGPNGTFELAGSLPATVPNGTARLTVAVAQSDAAIAATSVARDVVVEPTETSLTVDPGPVGADAVRVSGRLATADGTPVGGETVSLAVGGQTLTTTTTERGRYRARVDVPASNASGGRQVRVVARYDGTGRNLAPARATETVTLVPRSESGPAGTTDTPPGGPGTGLGASIFGPGGSGIPWSLLGWLGAGLLGLSVVAAGTRYALRYSPDDSTDGVADAAAAPQPTSTDDSTAEASTAPTPSPLAPARTALEAGAYADCVEDAYAVVRDRLADRTGTAPSATHWEFYAAAADADVTGLESLQDLTELYEATVFGPGSATEADASTAVDLADQLL